jgi:3-deoxy-D-manno-octulosonic-acid transferase
VATSQQIGLNQTDVFVVDKTGTLTVAWVVGGGAWAGPAKIGLQGLCLPGAPVSACQQTGLTQTDVFVMDRFGVLNVFWVSGGGAWAGPEHP